jgi:hypothetical protein
MDHKQQATFDFTLNESVVNPPLHSKVDILQFITECCSDFVDQVNLSHDGDDITLIINDIEQQDYTNLDKEFRDQSFFKVNRSLYGN